MVVMSGPSFRDEEHVGMTADDLAALPRVFAVDPGTTTGWAMVWFDDEKLFNDTGRIVRAVVAWQAGVVAGEENHQVDRMLRLLCRPGWGGEGCSVVVESFVVRGMFKQKEFLSPARIGAALDYALHRGMYIGGRGGEHWKYELGRVNWQSPADAKSVVTDARLKLWDMWLPGLDHPRDATRHALLWMRRLAMDDSLELFNNGHFTEAESA